MKKLLILISVFIATNILADSSNNDADSNNNGFNYCQNMQVMHQGVQNMQGMHQGRHQRMQGYGMPGMQQGMHQGRCQGMHHGMQGMRGMQGQGM